MSKLSRARTRYRRNPSNARLRAYLTLKGKAGIFDRRMLDYYGVPYVANKGVQKFLARAYGAGLVPTATTNGTHTPTSWHYKSRAGDVGLRREEIGTPKGLAKMQTFQRQEMWRSRHGKIHPIELFGPVNSWAISRSQYTALAEGSPLEELHDNHVHEAY